MEKRSGVDEMKEKRLMLLKVNNALQNPEVVFCMRLSFTFCHHAHDHEGIRELVNGNVLWKDERLKGREADEHTVTRSEQGNHTVALSLSGSSFVDCVKAASVSY